METFYDNEHLADCAFIFQGTTDILPAHKIVLASHSTLFKKLFRKGSTSGCAPDTILVGDANIRDDVRAVVRWMYDPASFNEWPLEAHVLQIRLGLAEKYGIAELEHVLRSHIIRLPEETGKAS